MDLSFSEQQEMLRKMARDFLTDRCPPKYVRQMETDDKGYSPELWREMAELGFMGLIFPEKYGGGGMDFMDMVVLLEEMGRACLPGPFFSSAIACGLLILNAGSEDQKQELLPKIASGEIILSLALNEPEVDCDKTNIGECDLIKVYEPLVDSEDVIIVSSPVSVYNPLEEVYYVGLLEIKWFR